MSSSLLQTEKTSPFCARKCFMSSVYVWCGLFIALIVVFVVLGIELTPTLILGERILLSC